MQQAQDTKKDIESDHKYLLEQVKESLEWRFLYHDDLFAHQGSLNLLISEIEKLEHLKETGKIASEENFNGQNILRDIANDKFNPPSESETRKEILKTLENTRSVISTYKIPTKIPSLEREDSYEIIERKINDLAEINTDIKKILKKAKDENKDLEMENGCLKKEQTKIQSKIKETKEEIEDLILHHAVLLHKNAKLKQHNENKPPPLALEA
ncbi:MAG: hypothetical protein KAJ86_04855 [Alphaproteobacteria bacterium]|nr:hypothetical protein [Alphaproteobacteria bacterium]